MNQRIREIKHQASLWCDKNIHPEQFSEGTTRYGRAWEDKFAELIVRECANRATWAQDTNAKDVGGEVLKHFGVEE